MTGPIDQDWSELSELSEITKLTKFANFANFAKSTKSTLDRLPDSTQELLRALMLRCSEELLRRRLFNDLAL